jgi:hypothetical protein
MRQLTINDRINIRALAREFPKIAKKEMAERFRKLKIGVTGDLLDGMSFRGKVLVNGLMVEIDYLYYGMYTDMGVGKGIGRDDVAVARLIGSGRKKKNWTRKLAGFRHRLGELYTEIAADQISHQVNQSFDRTLRFRL